MKRIKKNYLVTGLYALMLVGIVTGCDKDVYNPGNDNDGKLPPKEDYFDFTLTGDVQLSVNYDAPGYRAVIEVYDQYPMQDYKTKKEGISPIFVAYTDINGKYEGKMNIPTAVKEAYLYTSVFGLPSCVKLEASASGYTYDATKSAPGTRAATRAVAGVLNDKVPFEVAVMNTNQKRSDNMYSLTTWDSNGIPNLGGYLTRPEKVGAANEAIGVVSERVNTFLSAYNVANKVDAVCGNAKLLREPGQLNLKVPAGGLSVSVSFMGELARYLNSFGYYYYRTGETIDPAKFYKMKKYLVFPNASIGEGAITLKAGQTAKLLYFDESGNPSETFPEGYTIGWFLVSNGFGGDSFNAPNASGYVNQIGDLGYSEMPSTFYSLYRTTCMSDDTGTDRRFISVYDEKSKMYVIGVEDRLNKSENGTRSVEIPDDYMDLLFAVTTSKDLDHGDLEPIPPTDPEPEPVVLPLKGTVAFEDIWPGGGDYDLNDVMIEYNRDITFDTNNKALKAVETFKAVQKKGSATNNNFFACQYKHLGKMSLPAGVNAETATNSFVIEASAKDIAEGTVYQIERDLEGLGLSQTDVANDFNPYIIIGKYATENRVEVHLPLAEMTSAADESLMTKDNAYYVGSKDGSQFPFAINIPVAGFIPADEGYRIDLEGQYPAFASWAKSKGKTDTDWYLKGKGAK